MRVSRAFTRAATAVLLAAGAAQAQVTTHPPPAVEPAAAAPPAQGPSTTEKEEWSILASAYTYIVPDGRDYVQPTVLADRGVLHLEARYNYEGPDSGSLWLGYNFHFGDELALDLTPMVGGVFGDTAGVAPGYRFALSYWKLELASEGEYLFDSRDSSSDFFYSWSELSFYPAEWMRAGLVLQRTKLYDTQFDVQRGLLLGFTHKVLDFTAYVFDPGADQTTVVLALGLSF
jgi:hypothetical protein